LRVVSSEVHFLGCAASGIGQNGESTKPLIVSFKAPAELRKRLGLARTIPYRKDEVPDSGPYVTMCTRFAVALPSVIFGEKERHWQGRSSMRRRSRRGPNTSESTGRIGQELPSNQPAPLVPHYPDEIAARPPAAPRAQEPRQSPPPRQQRDRPPRPQLPAKPQWDEPAGSGRLEVETQPEMPSIPSPKPNAAGQTSKGIVVLAIGMPGSGKTTWFGRRGITPLSSDLLRGILFDDVEEQRYQGL